MLAAVKIKEEPLDEADDDLQEMFRQQEVLMKQQFVIDKIKDELHAEETPSLPLSNFHIVEEQDSMITVSAGDMKSLDEKQFIETLNNTQKDLSKFKGVCTKCLKMFTNRAHFIKHTKRNHCFAKEKCTICPVTFIDTTSLLKHLQLHQDNVFFCSQHCGANFKTLPLCEQHEMKEHKMPIFPKIRHDFFCSFCRESFKTELQLHVHWLQLNQGCGKIRQDVAMHFTNVIQTTNKNLNQNLNLINKKEGDIKPTNPSSVTVMPITKLRLKSIEPPSTNKRPLMHAPMIKDNDEELQMKRMKMFNQIKANAETFQLPFVVGGGGGALCPGVEIKEEPLDEEELNNMSTNLIPEVIIKTEEEDTIEEQIAKSNEDWKKDHKPEMKSLFINNMMNPEFNGKIIPLTVHTVPQKVPALKLINNSTNNNASTLTNTPSSLQNTNFKNLTNIKLIKLTPASIASSNKNVQNFKFTQASNGTQEKLMPLQMANGSQALSMPIQYVSPPKPYNNGNLVALPKTGLQILKFLPNTQVLRIKPLNPPTTASPAECSNEKKPLVIKLQSAPLQPIFKPQYPTNPPPLVPSTASQIGLIQTTSAPPAVLPATAVLPPPAATLPPPLNPSPASIPTNPPNPNPTLDTEDIKNQQPLVLIKKEEQQRKNFVIPKERLMAIESLPEKKQLIDIMKQQIAQAETDQQQQEKQQQKPPQIVGNENGKGFIKYPTDFFVLEDKSAPPSLYLPVLSTLDIDLIQARCKYPGYIYRLMCPYCSRDYEWKKTLQSHLTKAHNLVFRDMEKINVQAKPFRNREIIKEINQQQPIKEEIIHHEDNSNSQHLNSEEIDSNSNSSTTSPKPIQMSVFKSAKPSYSCEKCGRKCSSKTMLKDHVKANCSREPIYGCTKCDKRFFSLGTLQCHMSIHTGELPHKCNYCEKRFRTRGQVTVHHRTHTGERPFICQVCAQRFTHRETLISHLSRHIGMKRYKCYGCDKHFSSISALKTHRDLRPDTCAQVKFNPRAVGPRVRVIRGNVVFEAQPEINPYLKSEDPKSVLSELQNHQTEMAT